MPTNAVKPFDPSREYSGGQSKAPQRFQMRQGDPRVYDLFVEYTNFPRRTIYWEFRKKVVDLALVLFAGNYNWFTRQDSNSYITEQNYLFLLDTIRFIATGRRRINIHSWPMLLATQPSMGLRSTEKRRDLTVLMHELNVKTDLHSILKSWLSHKNGFDDLMNTLNLLFGTVPEKINK